MEVEDAEAAGEDFAGATAPLARRAGAWNRHDDAAVAGILAAARAAGASGAAVRYGGVVTKVWFEPHGSTTDLEAVSKKLVKLQLATAQSRIDELERRAAGASSRAKKETERKKKQKAAKKEAAKEMQQQSEQRRAAARDPTTETTTETTQQIAHAARQHLQQPTVAVAAANVVGPQGCRHMAGVEGQPASGLAPSIPTAIQPVANVGGFGAAGAGGGATARAAATAAPMEMDVVGPDVGRTTTEEKGMPVFGQAVPMFGGSTGSASAGASAPAAATHPAKFRRSDAAKAAKSKGAAYDDAKVLYASRPDGSVFGMAGVPGEKWASGK